MTVTARYISAEPVDGVSIADSMVLLKTPYTLMIITIQRLRTSVRLSVLPVLSTLTFLSLVLWSDKPKALYEIGYGFIFMQMVLRP